MYEDLMTVRIKRKGMEKFHPFFVSSTRVEDTYRFVTIQNYLFFPLNANFFRNRSIHNHPIMSFSLCAFLLFVKFKIQIKA